MVDFYLVWRPGLPIPNLAGVDVKGYLVSVAHYVKKPKIPNLHDLLSFKGKIIVDSGAYTFIKKGKMPEEKEIAELQSKLGADIAIPLDFPLFMAKTNKERKTFQMKTLANNDLWNSFSDKYNFDVFGVIQGSYNDIPDLIPQISQEFVALGGKAIQPTNGKIYSRAKLQKDIQQIKSCDKSKKIHLLGYSGIESFKKFAPLIDSFDTMAPQLYAGYRTILTDKPTKRKPKWVRYQSQSQEDLDNCPCPTCQNFNKMVLAETQFAEGLRYLHNTWWLINFYKKIERNNQKQLENFFTK